MNDFYGVYNEIDDEFEDDFDPDENPEFVAFMDDLAQNLKEFQKKVKIRIINPIGYTNFKKAFTNLVKLIQKDNPNAEISYELNDACDGGTASIKVISYGIDIDDVRTFASAIWNSFGIEFNASNEKGKTILSISFKNIYKDLFIGDSLDDIEE